MELYFGKAIENVVKLNSDELTHLIRVRRTKEGEKIHVTDGEGNLFHCRLTQIIKDGAEILIEEKIFFEKPSITLHLAVAPTKNMDRMEWMTEKATEIGIEKISFLNCRHSERKEIKTERLKKIAVSAMKQSGKYYLPVIEEMISFKEFVKQNHNAMKLICTMNAENTIAESAKNQSALILIGPEGDFNDDEIQSAKENGFIKTTLGHSRLRTETAAIAACVTFSNLNRE